MIYIRDVSAKKEVISQKAGSKCVAFVFNCEKCKYESSLRLSINYFSFFFSMEGGELFQRIQEKQAFTERGENEKIITKK